MNRIFLSLLFLAGMFAMPGARSVEAADVHIYELDNGMTVRLVPKELDGEVVVLLGVKAGFFSEPAGKPHLAHIVEHVVFHNIDANLLQTVAVWREENRANAETLADVMYFDLRVATEELESAIAVQASRLKIGKFFNGILEREVPLALAELDMVEGGVVQATSKFALAPIVQAAMHGRTNEPIRERTRQLTLDDVQAFYTAQFQPQRATLTIVGDFEMQQAMRLIARHFGRIPAGKGANVAPRALRFGVHQATWDVNRKHIAVAFAMPALRDEDHPSMTTLAYVMWQRLNSDVATRGASLSALLGPGHIEGVWLVNIALAADVDERLVLDKVKQQFEAISSTRPPSSGEVRGTTEAVKRLATMINEPPVPPAGSGAQRALAAGNVELQTMFLTLAYGDPRGYLKRVEGVTETKAAETASRRLKWENASVVVLTPKR